MGLIICRAKEWFYRNWLTREFPARGGSPAEAIIYATKGHDAVKHGAGS